MGTESLAGAHTITFMLPITNARAKSLMLIIEPWADEHELPPGATIEVVAQGPSDGTLHVETGEDYIIVYGWPGSTVALYQDGVNIGGADRLPVPPVPSGMSTQGFVRMVFGSRLERDGGE